MKVFSKRGYQLSLCVPLCLRVCLPMCMYVVMVVMGDGSHWKVGEHLEGLTRRVGRKEPSLCRDSNMFCEGDKVSFVGVLL